MIMACRPQTVGRPLCYTFTGREGETLDDRTAHRVAEVCGYKWYGLGQDLVGDASAGKKTEELAGLTEKFVSLLPRFLPEAEKARFPELKAAFKNHFAQTRAQTPRMFSTCVRPWVAVGARRALADATA